MSNDQGMSAQLTWAVPVNVVDLGAGLEAYLETIPVIDMLRLCNRFGQGPEAFITLLPTELLEQIEQLIVEPVHQRSCKTWQHEHRCITLDCEPIEHFDDQALCELYAAAFDEEVPKTKLSDEQLRRLEELDEDQDYGYLWEASQEKHLANRRAWVNRVDSPQDGISFFGSMDPLVRVTFGLDVWMTPAHLPNPSIFDNECRETFATCLVLPEYKKRTQFWRHTGTGYESEESDVYCGYGARVKISKMPTEASLKRFPRAMKTLGLEVFVLESQKGQALGVTSAEDGSPDEQADTESEWPQLTMLVMSRSTGRYN